EFLGVERGLIGPRGAFRSFNCHRAACSFYGLIEMAPCDHGRKPIDQWWLSSLAWVQKRDNPAGADSLDGVGPLGGLEAQRNCFRELSCLMWHAVEADSSTYRESTRKALNTGQISCRNFSYKAARYLGRVDIELAKFWPHGLTGL